MKKLLLGLAVLGLLFAGVQHASAAASGTLAGKAVRWSGAPIAGATVAALAGPLETDAEIAHTTTGADGSWSLAVPAGTPYWVHIRTFGTWWGYSYQTPFALQAGETVSQIYFVLGPRDVKEAVLPAPVSSLPAPVIAPPAVVPPALPATATAPPALPSPTPATAPISQVRPAIGYNNVPQTPRQPAPRVPVVVAVPPKVLPPTGAPSDATPLALVGLGLALLGLGAGLRRQMRRA